MNWLDRLERRFGSWCIPQFALFIVMANGLIYLLSQIRPEFIERLRLDPVAISQGEWWRVFTFLFVPPHMSLIWMMFWLLLLYQLALALENAWGDFRFFWFYAIGGVSMILASLFLLETTLPNNVPLNTTLFLAFATLFPDFEVLLFFILPVKVKWLALITWLGLTWSFIMGGPSTRITIAASLVNYALFFGPTLAKSAKLRWEVYKNRRRMGSSD